MAMVKCSLGDRRRKTIVCPTSDLTTTSNRGEIASYAIQKLGRNPRAFLGRVRLAVRTVARALDDSYLRSRQLAANRVQVAGLGARIAASTQKQRRD